MVFYRKYRPQTIDELVGQSGVKQALKSAVSAGKLAHAYLFCGPRGTGKTSTARILAKIVNCEQQLLAISNESLDNKPIAQDQRLMANNLPCNQCSSCISITDGSNLDVVEMDAASNRGIDDIRILRENIKLAPSSSKKKVYIIDEVHMLSGEAFNALLKTLEEPPSHVLFILATTEAQKIPVTILSRVQRLDFKPASIEELVEDLAAVAKKEDIKIDEGALLSLAKKANGSFRDGIKLLDQLSSFKKIDTQTVEENLGLGNFENHLEILENIATKNASEALKKLLNQTEKGINIKELTLSILDVLRQLLYIKNDLGPQLVKVEVGEDKYKLLENLATKFILEDLIYAINCFQRSIEQSRYVSIVSLPLEVAVVESCRSEKSLAVSCESLETKPQEAEKLDLPVTVHSDEITNDQQPTTNSFTDDLSKISDRWTYILETVRQNNYSLEALLRLSKISEINNNAVVVEVPYAFHQRILEAPKSRDLLESIFSDILGRLVRIKTVLGSSPVRSDEIANVEIAADDEILRIAAEIFNSETVN